MNLEFPKRAGIVIGIYNCTGNQISENSILSNSGLGIDLSEDFPINGVNPNDLGDSDSGPNNKQNFQPN